MKFRPRLETVEMTRTTIVRNSGKYTIYQLWRNLPKKMKYQTYKNAISHLQSQGEITDRNRKLAYIGRKKEKPEPIGRDAIIFNLSHYGYELITTRGIKKKRILPLEELLIQILIRYPEARLIEAIPILMLKNRIDKFELYRKAYDYNLINKMGFLAEIACVLARKKGRKSNDLEELMRALKQKKEESISYLSALKDKAFLEKTTPEIMKGWNLRGRFSLKDFDKEEYL